MLNGNGEYLSANKLKYNNKSLYSLSATTALNACYATERVRIKRLMQCIFHTKEARQQQ